MSKNSPQQKNIESLTTIQSVLCAVCCEPIINLLWDEIGVSHSSMIYVSICKCEWITFSWASCWFNSRLFFILLIFLKKWLINCTHTTHTTRISRFQAILRHRFPPFTEFCLSNFRWLLRSSYTLRVNIKSYRWLTQKYKRIDGCRNIKSILKMIRKQSLSAL